MKVAITQEQIGEIGGVFIHSGRGDRVYPSPSDFVLAAIRSKNFVMISPIFEARHPSQLSSLRHLSEQTQMRGEEEDRVQENTCKCGPSTLPPDRLETNQTATRTPSNYKHGWCIEFQKHQVRNGTSITSWHPRFASQWCTRECVSPAWLGMSRHQRWLPNQNDTEAGCGTDRWSFVDGKVWRTAHLPSKPLTKPNPFCGQTLHDMAFTHQRPCNHPNSGKDSDNDTSSIRRY